MIFKAEDVRIACFSDYIQRCCVSDHSITACNYDVQLRLLNTNKYFILSVLNVGIVYRQLGRDLNGKIGVARNCERLYFNENIGIVCRLDDG